MPRKGKEKKKIFDRGNVPKKGKEKKNGKGNVSRKKKKVQVTFLSIKQPHFLFSIFSLFWEENLLVSSERKHPSTTIYFPPTPPNQTYSKKVFLSIFSLKIFHLPYFTSKQTHLQLLHVDIKEFDLPSESTTTHPI